MINKLALCVGINDYPGHRNDLSGCVNDAKGWKSLLEKQYGFKVSMLLDKQATHSNVTQQLKNIISPLNVGDCFVFTYSGHGTSVIDRNGDEADKKDEALCMYDRNMLDDEIRKILNTIPDGVKVTIISDSCHSGTVTRLAMRAQGTKKYCKARYLPPEDDADAMIAPHLPMGARMFSEEKMKEVLITGCKSTEYSYDARINGKYQGAMSYHAIKIIKKNPSITYNNFYKELRKSLPCNKWPQTPQLEGRKAYKKQQVFIM